MRKTQKKFKQMKLKSILLITLTVLANLAIGQELTLDETETYSNQQVIEIDDQTTDKLFDKAMEWIALNYKSAQDVIQYSDKESGKIICKGNFSTNLFMKSGWIRHTLTIEFKEGRYRQTYSNFSYYSQGSGEMAFESKKMGFKKKIFGETSENINSATINLKKYLISKDDDW